jgi:hypothetical protein
MTALPLLHSGFAGAVAAEDKPEGEERMSVSAALQRFRAMEKLNKEQRALAEQQQAVLDAQRQQALTHRHSAGGNSPSVRMSCCSLHGDDRHDFGTMIRTS